MTLSEIIETASFGDFMLFSMWFWLANALWGLIILAIVGIFK